MKFIGRKSEIQELLQLQEKKSASMVVIRGRRRIGKSRLIEEFGKYFDTYYTFMGLAPEAGVTAQQQLEEFSRQMSQQFKAPHATYTDWSDALWAAGERLQQGKILLLFDEISWMGSKDSTFLGKIKNFWDQYLRKNDQLIFVICGSASAWIEKNILSSTGFVGRISKTLTLMELPLNDCARFWPENISAYEKLKVLSVTGGVPKYLEEITPRMTAEDNIRSLCFSRGGLLVEEFHRIFNDLFLHKSDFYRKAVRALASGPLERDDLCERLEYETGGKISDYLEELELAGFITRDYTWKLSFKKDSKLSRYRLSDNYLRFFVRYIEPNLAKIHRQSYHLKSLGMLPEWNGVMGLQVENLVLNNRRLIHRALGIHPDEIVSDNPYYQRKTSRTPGCQIDYLIQTRFGTLYVCEVKFSKNKVDSSVINDVQAKIRALPSLRGISFRPVLVHVNGVTEDLKNAEYFSSILDLSEFLVDPK